MTTAEHETGVGLAATVKRIAHLLPAQGPIGVFIHQNTLHAFQHLPFEDAVREAATLYNTEPFMTEAAYRAALASGRIRPEDIDAVLPPGDTLRRAMLIPGVREFHPETIRWQIEEEGLLTDAELFRICEEHVANTTAPAPLKPVRPRDSILATKGADIDDAIHPLLIRLCASFVDQGQSYWRMPDRALGLWQASVQLLAQPLVIAKPELSRLRDYARTAGDLKAEDAVAHFLLLLGATDLHDRDALIQAELLALPGWAGLIHQIEVEPSMAPYEPIPASTMDFLALRLLLTTAATATALGSPTKWRAMSQTAPTKEAALARAATLFDAAQLARYSSQSLQALNPAARQEIFDSIELFNGVERRKILHLAYERRHERQIILPLNRHREQAAQPSNKRPSAQVMFCIDEREESIRRQLEEVDPQIETLGAAGFFGVAIQYQGIDDAHAVPLCPVVVKPAHAVTEQPKGHSAALDKRRSLRRTWAAAARSWLISSRTFLRGWIGTTVLGVFSIFPMFGRILNPRLHGQLVAWLHGNIVPEADTSLNFERISPDEKDDHGFWAGFTYDELADRIGGTLAAAGLRSAMAPIVAILGHGSTSLNNPHESAHDCGACGGRRGGPSGRLFAAVANHPEVRKRLPARGVTIPDDTWFIGGYHDTCNDDVDLYDLDVVPASHTAALQKLRASLDTARARSAHERARRFEAAAPSIDAHGGLLHVVERSEHLAEPRPEYGHCTNAVCIIGRRSTTRGLFFDRRAFLISYDAATDPEDRSLAAILGAVILVCSGISLEYYFSFVDNEGYGCGTKLPHNVTGLVGVMNGYESDLRTGLPLQMVEIHEPVRILFVVEASPARLEAVVRKNAFNWECLSNRWIRLAAMDPATPDQPIVVYRDGVWEPVDGDDEVLAHSPAESSMAFYEGRREHLPVVRIGGRAA